MVVQLVDRHPGPERRFHLEEPVRCCDLDPSGQLVAVHLVEPLLGGVAVEAGLSQLQ